MTEPKRETAGAVRSANVAHFFSPDWGQSAQRAVGALERIDREVAAPQLVICTPDTAGTQSLTRELRALPGAHDVRIIPVTAPNRAVRLLADASAQVVVGTPTALGALLAATALKLDQVTTVMLVSADEFASETEALATLMAELPKGAARVLTAAAATPLVEELLERYMHRARKVQDAAEAETEISATGTPATIQVRLVPHGALVAPLGELLDDLDPPSAVIVVNDTRTEGQAQSALEALGYPAGSALVSVSRGPVALHTSLVIFLGLPDRATVATALDAHPARLVAVLEPRQKAALETAASGAAVIQPYPLSRAARAAKARDAALRATLRAALATGHASREVLALEPLLSEYDALDIAGAALRLYETAAAEAVTAKAAGREEIRQEQKAARAAEAAAAPKPREERSFGDRPSRPFSDRGASRGGPRPDKPFSRGPRSDAPRGDKPFSRGPVRGDGPRGDAPRDAGPPRGDRPERPAYGTGRPARSDSAAPRGDRPFSKGAPRSDRPFTKGPPRGKSGPARGGRDDSGPRGPRGPR